jgi:CheY-like chemotaxis protein
VRAGRRRVLIVDDTPLNVRLLAEVLRGEHETHFATSGPAALALLAEGDFDLVLLDVMMPEMDGFEVCRRIKADPKTARIPVIFVTAIGEVEAEALGFEVGGVDYITKPIQPAIVRARVRTHLELEEGRELLRRQARDLERQNEILQENARLKDDVERISRHDLKTPLNSIITLSQTLAEEPGVPAPLLESLRTIERAGYRLLEMVNRSLDLFKMEQGTYRLRAVPIDLRTIAGKVALDLQGMLGEKALRIETTAEGLDGEAPVALGDELLSYSLLANLLKNAAEASPPGEAVRIRFAAEGGAVAVRIENRGAVPPSLRARFFDKYTTDGKPTGTGLGTYSARLMAETQGGSIELDAGEAATGITVRLPAAPAGTTVGAEPAVAAPAPALPPREEWPSRRLLLVDDDEDGRRALAAMLDHPRWTIDEAPDAATALARFQAGAYDWVLVDLELPDLHGLELVARLRAREATAAGGRPAGLVAISAHPGAEMRERALAAGADRYLEKPARRLELVATLLGGAAAAEPARVPVTDEIAIDEQLRPLIPHFVAKKAGEIAEMHRALGESDSERVRRTAHRLRGSLDMYGFQHAARLCHEIEELARRRELPELGRRLVALADHWQAVAARHGGETA